MRHLQRYVYNLCLALFVISAVPAGAQSTVSLTSSSGHPGDEVEVSVMLSNAQSATALQINIPHSPYLSYVEGSAVLNKQRVSESHKLSVSDKDNLLSLYVYDISLNPFLEGSGAFITFRLKLDKEPGAYNLKPEVVLSDAGGKALSVTVQGSNIKILGPKIELSKTEIDYGSVPIRSTHTRKVSVSNTGNETLTVSEIKSGSSMLKVSPTSTTIAAGKQQTLTIDYTPQNAGNDLTDITLVSNATNGNQTIHVSAAPFSVNTLSVADVAGQSGEEVTVSVSMQNMEPIVAVQCFFTLPEAMKYVERSTVLSKRATGSHQISGTINDDQLSFFIHSADNTALSGNEGELFTFKLLLDGTGGDYPLTPTDVLLSNLAGRDMTSEVKGATIRIAAPRLECATELDFGKIPLEGVIKKRFTIRNSGESPLSIQRVEFSDAAFSLSDTNLPTISAGKTTDIEVCYRPSGEEAFTGIMQIYSNDPQNRMQVVEIKGTAYAPNEIELSGKAVSGQPNQYAITVSMLNTLPIVALQFDLHWIQGMVPIQESLSLSTRAAGHKAEITKLEDDCYRVFIYSVDNTPIAPGDGPIISLIYNNKVEGQSGYEQTTVLANQIILSTVEERNCASSSTAIWHISNMSGLLGDANNDGRINIQDVICIIRYLLGEIDSSEIDESLADMDQDHGITIKDLVGVIHAILNIKKQ